MKSSNNKTTGANALMLMLAPLAILLSVAAMNGGVLSASSFDPVVTSLKTMLTSTWVIMLCIVVLVVCVWQLAHGGSYKSAGLIIGVLAIALVGPGFVTSIATAMPSDAQVGQMQAHHEQLLSVSTPAQ